jgi:hypothetical protein
MHRYPHPQSPVRARVEGLGRAVYDSLGLGERSGMPLWRQLTYPGLWDYVAVRSVAARNTFPTYWRSAWNTTRCEWYPSGFPRQFDAGAIGARVRQRPVVNLDLLDALPHGSERKFHEAR